MFQLVVERGYEKGSVFALTEGDNLVGRANSCPIQLKAADVSRMHLVIRVNGSTAEAENLSGRAACQLDGAPLKDLTPLRDGQRLTLGNSTILKFIQLQEAPAPAAPEEDLDELPTRPASATPAAAPAESPPAGVELSEIVTMLDVQPPGPAKPEPAPGATQQIPDLKDESVVSDLLLSRPAGEEPEADDNGPASGFVDFTARPEPSGDDSFGPPSMIMSPPGSLLKRDTDFDPDAGPVSMIIDRGLSIPSGESRELESDGPRTRGLSREAMEYIRKQQRRKALIRLALIVGTCILLLVLLAMLIVYV